MKKQNKTIIAMAVVSVILTSIGLISGDPGVAGNMIMISIFLIVVPYFLYIQNS